MKYVFFYDETEHSRKINYKTVTANNYCDNFMTGIVGWKAEENDCVSDRYLAFESKYDYRKKDGKLKSQTMKTKDFSLGFASLNNHTIEFYEDLLSLFDEKVIIYFSVFSKIEYVISQLFVNYHNSMFAGFKKLLIEMNIVYYRLMIDREGEEAHTLNAAINEGLQNVTEEDSREYVGLRMADMFVGLISRLMQSLKISLNGDYKDGKIKKTLLDSGWFALNQRCKFVKHMLHRPQIIS